MSTIGFRMSLLQFPRILFFLLILFMICSCSKAAGKLLIMEANSYSSRGLFNEAITLYQDALEYADAQPFGEYGLGSVYFAMGEYNAALDRFSNALKILEALPSGSAKELQYRIHYNTGMVLFSSGDFSAAADSFRAALKTDGSRVDAKRNLELSLLSQNRENSSGNFENSIEEISQTIFFDFIQQREQNQWRDMVWPDEENSTGPDY